MSVGPSLKDLEEIEIEFGDLLDEEPSYLLGLDKFKIFNILNTLDLEYIENELKVIIEINYNKKIVSINSSEGFLIGEIKPGNYGKNQEIGHLYKYISPEYRGRGLGTLIYNIYKEHIGIPNMEVSSKISSIRFLLNNGYKLDSKLVGTEFVKEGIELDLKKILEIDYDIDTNDELGIIYKLVLQE